AAARAARDARPGHWRVRHVGPGIACVQRGHGGHWRQPDRHPLVARGERRAAVRGARARPRICDKMAVLSTDLEAASRRAQAGAPDDAEATHFLGVCLVRSGRRDEGLPLVERSVRLAPVNALYRQNFGLMLAEAGLLVEAEAQFQEILVSQENHSTAHNYLGMVRQRLGRMDEAIASYE